MEIGVVYKDNISYSAKITYGNREITSLDRERIKFISFYADMYIRVEDEERGIQKGLERGMEKGIEQVKIEVARNLLKMGMDLLAIMQATGLSKEEIEKIKADMN